MLCECTIFSYPIDIKKFRTSHASDNIQTQLLDTFSQIWKGEVWLLVQFQELISYVVRKSKGL